MPPDPSDVVPGWDDVSLLETTHRYRGQGTDEGLSDEIRFQANVAKLLKRRLAFGAGAKPVPSVFILCPAAPQAELVRVPMLDNGITEIEGHIWFVGPVAANGAGVEIEHWQDQEAFDLANSMHVEGLPAIFYEPRTTPPEARYYPSGLGLPDCYEPIRLSSSGVTIADVLDRIDRIYERSLKTPDAHHDEGKLWAKPTKHIPMPRVESRIAFYLREGLTGYFHWCVVREEQPQPSGRLDLEIEEPLPDDPTEIARLAILELKVLRSRLAGQGKAVSAAEIEQAVVDGVRQAASYAKERKSRESALCCFDMRTTYSGDECFKPVRALARRHKVKLRSWHLFNSSKAWREYDVL
jgi:hypothetical protein